MKLSEINDLIDGLENSETSLSNVRNLSALYIIRNHLLGSKIYDNTVKELNDILPSYLQYVEAKRKYQMGEITENSILLYLNNVCKEIKEFIQTLYSGTDIEQERELIQNLIKQLTGTF